MKKFQATILAFIIAVLLMAPTAAFSQDDMQDAKASFFGSGMRFNMDKPSTRARNLESQQSETVKEATNFKNMEGGMISELLDNKLGTSSGSSSGMRSRPIKDTKLLCEVCKAKAIIHSNENCEYCKDKSYANLCDKCIASSILNACDECKAKIAGKKAEAKKTETAKKEEVNEEKAAEEKMVKETEKEKIEEIVPDEAEKAVEKPKKVKKAVKKTKKVKKTEPALEKPAENGVENK